MGGNHSLFITKKFSKVILRQELDPKTSFLKKKLIVVTLTRKKNYVLRKTKRDWYSRVDEKKYADNDFLGIDKTSPCRQYVDVFNNNFSDTQWKFQKRHKAAEKFTNTVTNMQSLA